MARAADVDDKVASLEAIPFADVEHHGPVAVAHPSVLITRRETTAREAMIRLLTSPRATKVESGDQDRILLPEACYEFLLERAPRDNQKFFLGTSPLNRFNAGLNKIVIAEVIDSDYQIHNPGASW